MSGLRTRICDLFGCEVPIVQTGMGWVAGPRLVTATSAAGAFGFLASATMTLSELEVAIGEVQGRTHAPFGVNLRGDAPDAGERVQLLARATVKVASFASPPSGALVDTCHEHSVLAVPTVGARRHAEKMAALGVDALIAQGAEGGGHTGSVPIDELLPAVVAAVDIPVLAAGGFIDGHGLASALARGADGIAMGTRFLLTRESTVPESVKRTYLETATGGTVVTDRIDGAPQRVINTARIDRLARERSWSALPRAAWNGVAFARLTHTSPLALWREARAMRRAQELSWAQVLRAANAPMLTKVALVDGRLDAGILPSGEGVGTMDDLPSVAELVARITAEAETDLARRESV